MATALGWTITEINNTEWPDVSALLTHWQKYPPTHITLAIAHPTKPRVAERPNEQGMAATAGEYNFANQAIKPLTSMPDHIQAFMQKVPSHGKL